MARAIQWVMVLVVTVPGKAVESSCDKLHHPLKSSSQASTFQCKDGEDDSGLLQLRTQSAAVDDSKLKFHFDESDASKTSRNCTGENQDPWTNPRAIFVPCCEGFRDCSGDWDNNDTWSDICLVNCPDSSIEISIDEERVISHGNQFLETCTSVVENPSGWLWQKDDRDFSCAGLHRDDGVFACRGKNGVLDQTSIMIDLSTLSNKVGCWRWRTNSECDYQMRSVRHIEFDVEWVGCDSLWMAPLWTFSYPWVAPQGRSGEIDFVEECPVPYAKTNLGCYNAGVGGACSDRARWGVGSSSEGPKHMKMTIDDAGNLQIALCQRTGCETVATYSRYLDTVYPTSHGRGNPYHFVSDIFNDHGRDGGWNGCRAVKNPNSRCKFAVSNITLTSKAGQPFYDVHSICASLNSR